MGAAMGAAMGLGTGASDAADCAKLACMGSTDDHIVLVTAMGSFCLSASGEVVTAPVSGKPGGGMSDCRGGDTDGRGDLSFLTATSFPPHNSRSLRENWTAFIPAAEAET